MNPSLRRFLSNRFAVVGLAILMVMVVLAVFAGLATQYSPTKTDFGALRQAPSPRHIMGTDELGRDVFSRVLYGARVSLAENSTD